MKKYDRLIFVSNSDTCRGPMGGSDSEKQISALRAGGGVQRTCRALSGAGQSESRSNPGKPRADHERSYGEDAGTGRF